MPKPRELPFSLNEKAMEKFGISKGAVDYVFYRTSFHGVQLHKSSEAKGIVINWAIECNCDFGLIKYKVFEDLWIDQHYRKPAQVIHSSYLGGLTREIQVMCTFCADIHTFETKVIGYRLPPEDFVFNVDCKFKTNYFPEDGKIRIYDPTPVNYLEHEPKRKGRTAQFADRTKYEKDLIKQWGIKNGLITNKQQASLNLINQWLEVHKNEKPFLRYRTVKDLCVICGRIHYLGKLEEELKKPQKPIKLPKLPKHLQK